MDNCTISVPGQPASSIPYLGLGTAGLKGNVCSSAVCRALRDHGYRHIDTALLYGNQAAVGEGIRASGVPREEIFLTSKVAFFPSNSTGVWMHDPLNEKGREDAQIDLCLEQLGVDSVDLMLVHNGCVSVPEYKAAGIPHFFELMNLSDDPYCIKPVKLPSGDKLRPLIIKALLEEQRRANINPNESLAKRKRVWAAMERAQEAGKCRLIGVSNYPASLLEEMAGWCNVMPAVNQLEFTPRFSSPELRKVCERLGVVITGYGMLHGVKIGMRPTQDDDAGHAVAYAPIVGNIAKRLGKTPEWVVLRWARKMGVVCIPRSTNDARMQENKKAVMGDDEDDGSAKQDLTANDMALLDTLEDNYPHYWLPEATTQSMGVVAASSRRE